jgi:protein SCO1/2
MSTEPRDHVPDSPLPGGPETPRPRQRLRRPRWLWLGVAAVVLAATLAAASVWARVSQPTLQGGVVSPPAPTYDFTLRDQSGRRVRLSALRGKAVVLTFLYTHCPDACPLTAERLRETYERLGPTAQRVAFLAVSVDPAGDTPEAVASFLAAHRLTGELEYLTGSFAELKRVWAYYYVQSDAKPRRAASARAGPPAPAVSVGHSLIVYVLDPSGNLRVFLPANFESKDLLTDLKILAGGR